MNILGRVVVPITGALLLILTFNVNASQITSGVNIYNGIGESYGSSYGIAHVSDGSGLTPSFFGDFDSYIAGNPIHTYNDPGNEWHTLFDSKSLTNYLIFDLGDNYFIDKLALWNEDVFGIKEFSVSTSLDATSYSTVGTGLKPTDNPFDPSAPLDYGVDVFGLTTSIGRYIRIDITQNGFYSYVDNGATITITDVVSMGEIAFSTTSVPEPSTMLLLGTGLLGLAGIRKKKK